MPRIHAVRILHGLLYMAFVLDDFDTLKHISTRPTIGWSVRAVLRKLEKEFHDAQIETNQQERNSQ